MKIIDVLNKKGHEYYKVPSHEHFERLLELLSAYRVGSLVVTDAHNTAIGLVTERSVIEALAERGPRAFEATADTVMLSPVPSCRPDDDVRQVMSTMTAQRTRHLIVSDNAGIYGIVSLGDLVKYRLQDTELENLVLRDMAGAKRIVADHDGMKYPRRNRGL